MPDASPTADSSTPEPLSEEWIEEVAALPREQKIERLHQVVGELELEDRFELLHRLGIYHDDESVSGAGSSLEETASLRAALPDLVRRHRVESLLDVPCGDFHWMSRVDLAGLGVEYTGVDVVEGIVEQNRRRHAGEGRRFVALDAARDPLPRADLVLCRDLVVHLSLDDIRRLLQNFVRSGSRLLLVTHFLRRTRNPQIESGDFRPVNLCAPPFDLPPPVEILSEDSRLGDGAFSDRAMALWELSVVARALEG